MFFLILSAVNKFLQLVELLIFIDALLSWFIRPGSNQISRIIGVIVNPVIIPCRRLQQKMIRNIPVDLSPIIAIFLIELIRMFINIVF